VVYFSVRTEFHGKGHLGGLCYGFVFAFCIEGPFAQIKKLTLGKRRIITKRGMNLKAFCMKSLVNLYLKTDHRTPTEEEN